MEGKMAKFWTIRAGKQGERTQWAINKGLIGGGWQGIPDLTGVTDKEQLRKIVEEVKGGSKNVVGNYTGQLWAMTNTIQPGDYMVLSIRATSQVAIGEVTKGYHYLADQEDPNQRHVLGVKWLKTDIPKTAFKQDLLYQMGSALTVFRLGNNDAEYRLEQVLATGKDPGARTTFSGEPATSIKSKDFDTSESVETESLDLEQIAQDEIAKRLEEDFKGHELSELVSALLTAEGFSCFMSPPGSDGGADVLAGMGPLGMDSPKLVVQVKSQTNPVSDTVIQQLDGAIRRFKADQALLVTFGGVTGPAKNKLETEYFNIRVWTMDDILQSIYKNYNRLPNDLRARIPMKQIWVPFNEDE
jgi:restriction system protein